MDHQNQLSPRLHTNPRFLKHAAGQACAPFVGEIVSQFNAESTADTAFAVQWLISSSAAFALIELQHHVHKLLKERLGAIKTSLLSIVAPSAITTTASYVGHSFSDSDAVISSTVVGILSLLGYGTLQGGQILIEKVNHDTRGPKL